MALKIQARRAGNFCLGKNMATSPFSTQLLGPPTPFHGHKIKKALIIFSARVFIIYLYGLLGLGKLFAGAFYLGTYYLWPPFCLTILFILSCLVSACLVPPVSHRPSSLDPFLHLGSS